jgi:hypothetical protein
VKFFRGPRAVWLFLAVLVLGDLVSTGLCCLAETPTCAGKDDCPCQAAGSDRDQGSTALRPDLSDRACPICLVTVSDRATVFSHRNGQSGFAPAALPGCVRVQPGDSPRTDRARSAEERQERPGWQRLLASRGPPTA